MSKLKNLKAGFAFTALALALTTMLANAQSALQGTFELPAAAYWGDTLLHPGHYTISMKTGALGPTEVSAIHLSGEGLRTTVLSLPCTKPLSGRSYLEVADVGGTYVVRAFNAGYLGKTFAFNVTKSVRNKVLRASAAPAVKIPVTPATGF